VYRLDASTPNGSRVNGAADPGRRVAAAFAATRRQIDRDLRERLQLHLIELRYELRQARQRVPPDAEQALDALGHVEDRLDDALDELHAISARAYPPALSVVGLAQALRSLARRSRLPVDVDVTDTGRLPGAVELAACDVVAEALADAEAHADATRARVQVRVADRRLDVVVAHDGSRQVHANTPITSPVADQVKVLGGTIAASGSGDGESSLVLMLPFDTA
jgi:signal transduction histidine kinase